MMHQASGCFQISKFVHANFVQTSHLKKSLKSPPKWSSPFPATWLLVLATSGNTERIANAKQLACTAQAAGASESMKLGKHYIEF